MTARRLLQALVRPAGLERTLTEHSHQGRGPRRDSVQLRARTSAETPYISHHHVTRAPRSSRRLPLLNQKLLVIAGSVNAANTSDADLRISISAFTTGACESSMILRGEREH